MGEVESLDADGKVLLCFILTQLVVNHSQVICCSTTRLERLFGGELEIGRKYFLTIVSNGFLSPPTIQIRVSHLDGCCLMGNGKRRASADPWKKLTVSKTLFPVNVS